MNKQTEKGHTSKNIDSSYMTKQTNGPLNIRTDRTTCSKPRYQFTFSNQPVTRRQWSWMELDGAGLN